MQPSFLEKLAIHVVNNEPDLDQLCFVFPSKRSGIFFKKELAKQLQKSFWAPKILTIEKFVEEISGIEVISSLDQMFEFFEVYQTLNISTPMPLAQFIDQSKIVLADFNDLDMAQVDHHAFFGNVKKYVALEDWDVTGKENSLAAKYLNSWDLLPQYYQALRTHLLNKNKAYQGLAYSYLKQQVKENEDLIAGKLSAYSKVYVAGLNAVSPAEKWFFDTLKKEEKLEMFFDAETQMLVDKKQESGMFLRQLKNDLPTFNWVNNYLTNAEKNIHTYAVNGPLAIAKSVPEILHTHPELTLNQNTAVVLGDETLLVPVLESLPAAVEKVNVTLGVPLGITPFMSIAEQFFTLHTMGQKRNGTRSFYFKDVLKILNNPVLGAIIGDNDWVQKMQSVILFENKTWLSADELTKTFTKEKNKEWLAQALQSWKKEPLLSVEFFDTLILQYERFLDSQKQQDDILVEQLYFFKTALQKLMGYVAPLKNQITLEALRKLFKQVVSPLQVPFSGEPLQGVQVLGLLETRLLRFDNVVFLSANEGAIPKTGGVQSNIPFAMRVAFGIQTHTAKESVFAYHFYRLLTQAKNIHIVYNTGTSGMTQNEPSRFVRQMEVEWPALSKQISFTHHVGTFADSATRFEKVIPITDQVEANILTYLTQNGISASAFNTYTESPYHFYIQNVLGVREPDEISEDLPHNVFGTIVHETLEEFYKPFVGQLLSAEGLKAHLPKLNGLAKDKFKAHVTLPKRGIQVINYDIVQTYVQRFVASDILYLQQPGVEVHLVALELKLTKTIEVDGHKITLKGEADRIEKRNGVLTVTDFKTGNVEAKKLKMPEFSNEMTNGKHPKLTQLLYYAVLAQEEYQCEELAVGIYPLQAQKSDLLYAEINKQNVLQKTDVEEAQRLLAQVIGEMLHPEEDLTVGPDYVFGVV